MILCKIYNKHGECESSEWCKDSKDALLYFYDSFVSYEEIICLKSDLWEFRPGYDTLDFGG